MDFEQLCSARSGLVVRALGVHVGFHGMYEYENCCGVHPWHKLRLVQEQTHPQACNAKDFKFLGYKQDLKMPDSLVARLLELSDERQQI